MHTTARVIAVTGFLLLPPAAVPAAWPGQAASAATIRSATFDLLSARGEVYQPQFAMAEDDRVVLVWREAEGGRSDLFASRLEVSGSFSAPVRVNQERGSVPGMDLDESRPAIAIGPGGQVAVAWSGPGTILAAVSPAGGLAFGPTIRLDHAPEPSYRGFVSAAFDQAGVLHAAWIDGREAPPRMEEPADLYYATLEGAETTEHNLTANQESSICGCCRTHLAVQGGRVRITFRNTSDDGFRDIFVAEGSAGGPFAEPLRAGPKMWELRGCPVQGPISVGNVTLWNEASTGHRRLLSAVAGDDSYSVVLEDGEGWRIASPPRLVAGSDEELLLVPGRPSAVLLRRSGDSWRVVHFGLPVWATSGVSAGAGVVLLGAVSGEPMLELVSPES